MDKQQLHIPLHQPVGADVPSDKTVRDRLKAACRDITEQWGLVGPLSLDALKSIAAQVLVQVGLDEQYLKFTIVILNNEVYRKALSRVPFEKRLLLLPRCMRDETVCKGQFDEIGLLCRGCGGCGIDALTQFAQRLGYSVLVAEGSPVVMGLLEAGGIEAVVGVSCLSMLEKMFPYMEAAAFPGVAVPLLYDGCVRTAFDVDWLMDFLETADEDDTGRLDLRQLRQRVQAWFEPDALARWMGQSPGPVEKTATEWLALAGKRWRPALAAGVWATLTQTDAHALPQTIQKTAVAVECFHKASLIHDDIEDGDDFRYGQKTLHAQMGVPIALNIGDYLIGLGYQLLAELEVDTAIRSAMLSAAAQGHRVLCLGQGAELDWMHRRHPLSRQDVLRIFEQKTSPAFEVALKLGAILAGADHALLDTLTQFSRYVGQAYQIRDDILDWMSAEPGSDTQAARLSIVKAIALEKAVGPDRDKLMDVWNGRLTGMDAQNLCKALFETYNVIAEARGLLADFGRQARECLEAISCGDLKVFLRRVLAKILDELGELSCCEDHSPRHD